MLKIFSIKLSITLIAISSLFVEIYGQSINTGIPSGKIVSCWGTASSDAYLIQFSVSASSLTSPLTITSPIGFEVSLASSSGFGSAVHITPVSGNISNKTLFVRSAVTALVGQMVGDVLLTSSGATTKTVVVSGTIYALPIIQPIINQTVAAEGYTNDIIFSSTGGTSIYNWISDAPSIGLASIGADPIPSFQAHNTGTTAIVSTITVTPLSTGLAYVPDGTSKVNVINTNTNTILTSIPVDNTPTGVAVSPNNNLVYVTNSNSDNVSVIQTNSNTVIATIAVGGYPIGIVVNSDGGKVYVVNYNSDNVSVISTTNNAVVASIGVGSLPNGIAISPDGTRAYVSSMDGVSVINTSTNAVIASIPANSFFAIPTGIAVSPDGKKVYVANGGIVDNNVTVIEALTNTVTGKISVGSNPYGVAISPDGSRIYVTNTDSNTLSIINTDTQTTIATVGVGSFPYGISLTPDGSKAYIVNQGSSDVSVMDTNTNTVIASIPALGSFGNALGNFITLGTGCSGPSISFTITVNPPAALPPVISVSGISGTISACEGTPSSAPAIEQFTVSGNYLNSSINITAPNFFEISITEENGYTNTVTVPASGGIVAAKTIYVRSTSAAPAGSISGNIRLTSTGAITNLIGVTGTVYALPIVNNMVDYIFSNSITTDDIYFSGTANQFTWTNSNSDIGLAANGNWKIPSFITQNNSTLPITSTITVTPGYYNNSCTGGSITFTITVRPETLQTTSATGKITSCFGMPSASPDIQKFVVTGDQLISPIVLTAPDYFEISKSINSNYGKTFSLTPSGGKIDNVTIFVRSSASAPVGTLLDSVMLTAINVTTRYVTVKAKINSLPVIHSVENLSFVAGIPSTPIQFSGTGGTLDFTWNNANAAIGLQADGSGSIPAFTPINSGTTLITTTLQVTPISAGYAYILNRTSNNVSVINTRTNTLASTVAVGITPVELVFSPDGSKVYITNYGSNNVYIISTQTNTVLSTIDVGNHPDGIAISPDGNTLFVNGQGFTSAIDTKINTIINQVTGGGDIMGVSPDGNRIFIGTSANTYKGLIKVLNAKTLELITFFYFGEGNNGGRAICFSPDGGRLYVTGYHTSVPYDPSYPLHSDIRIFDMDTYTEIGMVSTWQSDPYQLKISSDGDYLYTVDIRGDLLTIDTHALSITDTVNIGGYAMDFSISGNHAYSIDTSNDSNVRVTDLTTGALTTTVDIGGFTRVINDFITRSSGCAGAATSFLFTVYPENYPLPTMNSTEAAGSMIACVGSASNSVQQFTLSGTNVSSAITVSAPLHFEISTTLTGVYSSTLSFNPVNSTLSNTIVYVRTVSSAPSGLLTGDVILTSLGANTVQIGVTGRVSVSPTLVSSTWPNGTVGIAYFFELSGIPFGFSSKAVNLPSGLSMDNDGKITGTPTQATSSSLTISVSVTNGVCSQTISYLLNVDRGIANIIISVPNLILYDGSAKSATVSTLPEGLPLTILYDSQVELPVHAGVYTIYATVDAENYYGEKITYFTINKSPLTIKANSATRKYKEANPALTMSFSGFVNQETQTVLDVLPSIRTEATTNSIAGIYPILLSGGTDNNYDLILQFGGLTIEKINQSIDFLKINDKPSNSDPFSLIAVATSVLPVKFRVLSGPATINANILTLTGVGEVTVMAYEDGDYNFLPASVSQTFSSTVVVANEPLNRSDILIFPNPASDWLNITLPKSLFHASIELIDSRGVRVLELNSFDNSKVNIAHLSKGVDLIRIKQNQQEFLRRLIII